MTAHPALLKSLLLSQWMLEARTWGLALNSAWLVLGTLAIAIPLGTLLALLLARTDVPGRSWGILLIGSLLFMPLYLQSAAWEAGFGIQGWYLAELAPAGTPPLLYGWRGAIWIHGLAAVPWVALIVAIGLRQIPPEWEEEALLNSAAGLVLARVTLLAALPAVAAAALWVAVSAAGEIAVTDMWQLRTYAEEIYVGFALGDDPQQAPLQVLPGMLLICLFVAAALLAGRWLAPRHQEVATRSEFRYRLHRWRLPAAVLLWALLLLLVGVPVANLVWKAGAVVELVDGSRQGSWQLAHAGRSIFGALPLFHEELFASLGAGALAASGAILVATPLAWWGAQGGWRALPALVVIATLLAIPGPVLGLGIIELLNRPDLPLLGDALTWLYDHSILAPWLAMLLRALPLTTLVLWHALRDVPRDTLRSAATEGAGSAALLLRVALPQRRAALAGAWLAALAIAMADISATILVLPPGMDTLARRIFGLVHYGVDDQLAGVSLLTGLLFVLLAAAAMWLIRRDASTRLID